MTAQEREKLFYRGIEYSLNTEPLGQYFSKINKKPD